MAVSLSQVVYAPWNNSIQYNVVALKFPEMTKENPMFSMVLLLNSSVIQQTEQGGVIVTFSVFVLDEQGDCNGVGLDQS